MMRPVQHPSTQRLMCQVMGRLLRLRSEQKMAEDAMWAGRLAAGFTVPELALLRSHLSPRDLALLRSVGRLSCVECMDTKTAGERAADGAPLVCTACQGGRR